MKVKNVGIFFLVLILAISGGNGISKAQAREVSTYAVDEGVEIASYQESLLVSFEIWETAFGTEIHNEKYKTYRFANGYREVERTYTPIGSDISPLIRKNFCDLFFRYDKDSRTDTRNYRLCVGIRNFYDCRRIRTV